MRARWRWLRAVASRPVSLPVVRWRVPAVLLWAGLAIFALTPLGGLAIVASNQPVFCKSCHEMGLHHATWSQSGHREVGCEECHIMPGKIAMFKAKLHALRLVQAHTSRKVRASLIQGHVPDENCRRCHPETPELVTYHGLKITHRAHWQMGVKCTFCHDRVVHGPKWLYTAVTSAQKVKVVGMPFQNAPQMETCYRCHDGRRAPNTCSTCHVTLGERRPTAFQPAWVTAHRDEVSRSGEENCRRCHSPTFCEACHRAANPHPGGWLAQHSEQARRNPKGCASCHLAPGEAQPRAAKDMAFCRACHGLRQEHRQADWQIIHGRESLSNPASCQRCHTQSWCSDCHAISRPHPQEWLARHPAEANRNPGNCQVCHTQQFCDACHHGKQGVPASHQADWLTRHKDAARGGREMARPDGRHPGPPQAGLEACTTCHRAEFCQSCHAEKAPVSHGSQWLSQHGTASNAQPAACLLCHTERHCDQCHGMTMPHPKLWLASHHRAGAENRALCERCHQKRACDTCHRGAFPTSHQPSDWMSRHGAEAKKPGAACSTCHRDQFCSSCHGLPIPHPSGWAGPPHGTAAAKGRATCARCHQDSQCTACHGLAMPHPEGWMSEHGKKATASPAVCTSCHGPGRHECTVCHAALAPPSHQEESWKQQHGTAGAAAMALCALCHGSNVARPVGRHPGPPEAGPGACADCHAKAAAAKARGS